MADGANDTPCTNHMRLEFASTQHAGEEKEHVCGWSQVRPGAANGLVDSCFTPALDAMHEYSVPS